MTHPAPRPAARFFGRTRSRSPSPRWANMGFARWLCAFLGEWECSQCRMPAVA
jgi:hypothetical protein